MQEDKKRTKMYMANDFFIIIFLSLNTYF